MCFQGDHIRLRANVSCFSCPAPNLFGGQGDRKNETKFLKGMIDLQAQAQKFLMQLFSKNCDFGRLF
jgi:hypothetical protein